MGQKARLQRSSCCIQVVYAPCVCFCTGFITAREALRCAGGISAEGPVDDSRLLVWDVGGASFQIVGKGPERLAWDSSSSGLQVYEGPLGASIATAALVQEVQGHDFAHVHSPNPVSLSQAEMLAEKIQAMVPPCPNWLQQSLEVERGGARLRVAGIGGKTCVFRIAAMVLGKLRYNADDVWEAVKLSRICSDAELAAYPQPDMVVPKLVAVYAVMKKLQIPHVDFKYCNGSCIGILCSADAWV